MATFLYRLGSLAFRRRWLVVVVWVAVLGVVGIASSAASDLPENSRSMPDIEAQRAFELAQQRFPGGVGDPDTATAEVVFVAGPAEKVTDQRVRTVIEQVVTEVARGPQVVGVVSPFQSQAVSNDGSTAYATVAYKASAAELTDDTRQVLRTAVERARTAGLTVDVGGPVLASEPSVGGVSELVGILLAALVLLVTFGSLVAAGLPLLTAILGVGISMLTIFAVGEVFGLSSTSSTLATMLGLAVGIDYALFVISRYREERARGHAPPHSTGRAVSAAGSAVVFAGLTVMIALAGLAVLGIPAAGEMGVTAAGAVGIAVLIALTLVPALLGFFPNAVLARRVRAGAAPSKLDNMGSRWARFVLRRPVPVLFGSVAALIVLALPVLDLQLGMPGDEAKSTETTERRAHDELAKAFGPGFTGPLTIVVAGQADEVRTVSAKIASTPGVVSVSPPRFNPAGDAAVFTAVPATAPTSEETKDLVRRIRAERQGDYLVTGTTAVNIDVAQKVMDRLVPYLAIVLGLAFLLLLVVFRSLLVPLKAVLGFLLSMLASLGVVIAVFQWGWAADLIGLQQTGPIISMMPIVLVGITFGLAMDYEVFLVARIREAHDHGQPARQAVLTGFRHSARVVAAAALIMVAVFAGFVGADLPMIKMIGFSLAAAVLFDAFIVRMTLVPAVLALLGERAWTLPKWLDRRLPRVEVERQAADFPGIIDRGLPDRSAT